MNRACSICSAPNAAADTVNALLARKTPFAEIAGLSGFSKSAIGRHSLKCFVRARAVSHRAMRFDAERHRLLTALPSGNFFVQANSLAPKENHTVVNELRADDWVIRVSYTDAAEPRASVDPGEATDLNVKPDPNLPG